MDSDDVGLAIKKARMSKNKSRKKEIKIEPEEPITTNGDLEDCEEIKGTIIRRADALGTDHKALQNELNSNKELDYPCSFCRKSFYSSLIRKMHLLSVHQVKYCEVCDLLLTDEADVIRHEEEVHSSAVCEICRGTVDGDVVEHYKAEHDAAYCAYCNVVMQPASHRETHLTQKHLVKQSVAPSFHCEDILRDYWDDQYHCNMCATTRKTNLLGHFAFYHKINVYQLAVIFKRMGIVVKSTGEVEVKVKRLVEDSCKVCQGPVGFHKVCCENYVACGVCFELFEGREDLGEHIEGGKHAVEVRERCVLCKDSPEDDHLWTKHKVSEFNYKLISYDGDLMVCDLCEEILVQSVVYSHFKDVHLVDDECMLPYVGARDVEDIEFKLDFDFRLVKCWFDETIIACGSSAVICEICSELCDDYLDLVEHLHYSHNLQDCRDVTDCEVCPASKKKETFKRHLRHYAHDLKKMHKCEVCSRPTRFLDARSHILERHPDSLDRLDVRKFGLSCRFCDEAFWENSALERHEIRHHLDEQNKKDFLECSSCKNIFSRLESLRQHDNCDSYAEIAYQCAVCHIVYTSIPVIRKHFATVHPKLQVFLCPSANCHKFYGEKKNVKRHYLNTHGKPKKKSWIKCDECPRGFHKKDAYKNHMALHTKGFACVVCGEKFPSSSSRKFHYSTKHSEKLLYECKKCEKAYLSKSSLHVHKIAAHTDYSIICQYCHKEFTRPDSYKEHMLIHVGPKHKCPHCPKIFTQTSNLRRHIRIHTGEKPYKCKYCEKSFSDSGARVSHQSVHTRDLECACEVCGKKFSKKQKMKYHMKSHTIENLTTCKICKQRFSDRKQVKEHLKTHQFENQCLLCRRYYVSRMSIISHLRTSHGVKKPDFDSNIRVLTKEETEAAAESARNEPIAEVWIKRERESASETSPEESSSSEDDGEPASPKLEGTMSLPQIETSIKIEPTSFRLGGMANFTETETSIKDEAETSIKVEPEAHS